MKFEVLKHRVERSEELVAGRMEQTRVRAKATKSEWRDAWTPLRIIVVGLVAGFAAGHVKSEEAVRKLGRVSRLASVSGSSWLGTLSTVSRLVMVVQSTIAAFTAKDAADTAEAATDDAKAAVDAAHEVTGSGNPASATTAARDRSSDDFPTDDSLRH